MVEDKEVRLPNVVLKNLFTALMVVGILLYLSWSILLIVTKGIFFDIGLYSTCIVMILGGLAGRLLYGHKDKVEA